MIKTLKHFLFALVSVSMVLLTVSCANDSSSSDESSEENTEYTKENIDKIVSNIEYSETAQNIIDKLTSDEVKGYTSLYYFNGEENDGEGIVVKTIFGSDNTLRTIAYKKKYDSYSSFTGKAYKTNLSGNGYYYLNAEGSSIYLIYEKQMLEAPVGINDNNEVYFGSTSLLVNNNSIAKFFAKNFLFHPTVNSVLSACIRPISKFYTTLIDEPDPDDNSGSGTTIDSSEITSKIEGTWYIKGTSNSTSDGGTAVFSNGTVTYTPDVNKTSAKYEGTYSVDNGVLKINGTVTISSTSRSEDTFTVSFTEDSFTITSKTATDSAPSGILTIFFQRTNATSLTFYSSK